MSVLNLFLLFLLLIHAVFCAPRIHKIRPYRIGRGGATITIHGQEFASDQFNYFDKNLGNVVKLTNDVSSQECHVLQYKTSEKKIECETGPREVLTGSSWYRVYITVDGEPVSNSGAHSIEFVKDFAPYITEVTPVNGPPGTLVTLKGNFMTDKYQESGTLDEDEEPILITGVRVGPKECNLLQDDGVTLHGLTKESLTCKIQGTYVGDYGATVYVSGKYGTAEVYPEARKVSATGGIYVHQAYPVISSISPQSGSVEGGTLVTITGQGFDAQPGQTDITVAGNACDIEEATSEKVKCRTPKEPDSAVGDIAGGRGLTFEKWDGTVVADIRDLASVSTSDSGYSSEVVDQSKVEVEGASSTGFTGKLSGLFVAPVTGSFQLFVASDGEAVLYLSTSSDPSAKSEVASVPAGGSMDYNANAEQKSALTSLVKGTAYYIEAAYKVASSSGSLKLGLYQPDTEYTPSDVAASVKEKQVLYIKTTPRIETQVFDFMTWDASVSSFRFVYNGVKSSEVSFDIAKDATENIEKVLWELMTPKCEATGGGQFAFKHQGFEDKNERLDGERGSIVDNVECFCGRRCLRNSWRLFAKDVEKGPDISVSKMLCFAYKGKDLYGKAQIYVKYKRTTGDFSYRWVDVMSEEIVDTMSWKHLCVDLLQALDDVISDRQVGAAVKLGDLRVPSKYSDLNEVFLDEVSVTAGKRTVTRIRPAAKHADDIVMRKIDVTKSDSEQKYTVELISYECHGGFPLIGVIGSGDSITANLTQSLENGQSVSVSIGTGSVSNTRTVIGSNPVGGTWGVTFDGRQVTDLAPDINKSEMQRMMEVLTGSPLKVWTWGNCDKRHWTIEWQEGGDKPDMTPISDKLVIDGPSLDNAMWPEKQGGLMIDTLNGDFFRTSQNGNWLSVTVNKMSSVCDTTDKMCKFTYDSASTPTVTSKTDSVNGDGTISVTITGTLFSTTITDNVVKAGDEKCKVTSATATTIECTVAAGPAGSLSLKVFSDKGLATMPAGGLSVSRPLSITAISPSSGSVGGGIPLVITGSGLPSSLSGWESGSASVGGEACAITGATISTVTCIVPPQTAAGAQQVTVTVGGESATSPTDFTYTSTSVPTITSFLPASSSVTGGVTLTISGTDFGTVIGDIKIGTGTCTVDSWTDTSVLCTLPGNAPGSYEIKMSVGADGHAWVNTGGSSTISYGLKVTGLTPNQGSLMGGTKVAVQGEGFGTNCDEIDIKFGTSLLCEVDSCTDTLIMCTTKKNRKIHEVTNSGKHKVFGIGYEWKEKNAQVDLGDLIKWSWFSEPGAGTTYGVWETESATKFEPKAGGFKSGDGSPSGQFIQAMNEVGTFYYCGPEVQENYCMSGTVTVNDLSSEALKMKLTVADYEAEQDTAASPTPPSLDEGACAASSTGITGCSEALPTDPADGSFYFLSWKCLTASVTKMSLESKEVESPDGQLYAYSGALLALEGSGFSTDNCQNMVSFGDASSCTVITSSETNIKCTISEEMDAFTSFPITTKIFNMGAPISSVGSFKGSSFVLVPQVTSFSPTTGSTAGGFLLTIQGSGFQSSSEIKVTVGDSLCEIKSQSFSEITCVGGPNVPGDNVAVAVIFENNNLAHVDSAAGGFTYLTDGVPVVGGITPAAVDAQTPTLTINGTGFGTDDSLVNIILRKTVARKRDLEIRSSEQYQRTRRRFPTRVSSPYLHFADQLKDGGLQKLRVAENEHSRQRRSVDPLSKYEIYLDTEEDEDEHIEEHEIERVMRCVDIDEVPEIMDGPHHACRSEFIIKEKREERDAEIEEREVVEEECEIQTITDTQLTCTISDLPAGSYSVVVNTALGDAVVKPSVTVNAIVTAISPTRGSIHGGTSVTLTGSGFDDDSTVAMDGAACTVTAVSVTSITCMTSGHAEGAVSTTVTVGSLSASIAGFNYEAAATPTITAISPATGAVASSVTLTGSNFELSGATVSMGDSDAVVTSQSDTEIAFTVPSVAGGSYDVMVKNSYGNSNTKSFEVPMSISSISPQQGSSGGGTLITVSGIGFSTEADDLVIEICAEECEIVSLAADSVSCRVPALPGGGDQTCDIVATQGNSVTATLATSWTYSSSLTPTVTNVTPKRGGTGGGTVITITGTDFESSGNVVTIDGSSCVISSESTTEIVCTTDAHDGTKKVPVTVEIPGKGYASTDDSGLFHYIDLWSSKFSWGGEPVPQKGDFIVIPEGKTIYLDTDTEVLSFLLLDGGHLVFDKEQSSVELHAEYILIINDGSLSIGSEDDLYQNDAAITMHGHTQSTELPMFGAKVVAVRKGTIDLHGKHVPITWTHLAQPASAGDTTIKLLLEVTWKAGDEIVIASTGKRHSMGENEKKTIDSVSPDGKTITLTTALEYDHISMSQTFGGKTVETRAEVGLLTRNVKFRGNVNQEFVEKIEACDGKFDSGQFKTQTCFEGKFGEEIGSEEFGATLMMFAREPDKDWVVGRIEYVEVTEAGQAFRLGRYPIHYHLNGDIKGNYVRGCGIHRTYNRAITIHAVNYLLIEHVVAFDNKGHAIFTEDGNEKFNTIQYNLVVYTKGSSSLLNVDITPASYWLVNPANTVRHNAAAGGTHFGYWYRLEAHPSGPSYTSSYCQNHVPLGEFYNNTAHTYGWYGLWVFSMDGWFPMDNDGIDKTCNKRDPVVARFGDFTAWRCERGMEMMFGGPIRFHNATVLDNEKAGIEFMQVDGPYGMDGPGISDALVIGHSAISSQEECTERGIVTPKMYRMTSNDITFVNFDTSTCAAYGACSQCKEFQGGFKMLSSGLEFINSPNKVGWKHVHETTFEDMDGTLTGGAPGSTVIPQSDILPSHKCTFDAPGFNINPEIPGAICRPDVTFHRMSWNEASPHSLKYQDVILENQYGSVVVPYHKKKLTHPEGWMGILVGEEDYLMSFDGVAHVTNISYKAGFYQMKEDNYVYISHNLSSLPDIVVTENGEHKPLDHKPDPDTDVSGDWTWENETNILTYMISHNEERVKRGGPSIENTYEHLERHIDFKTVKCLHEGCVAPTLPPSTGTPDDAENWSDDKTWANIPEGYGGHGGVQPEEGSDVIIPADQWIVADKPLPKLNKLYIFGVLEIEDKQDNILDASVIIIRGGRLIAGWPETDKAARPFTNEFTILLRGDHSTEEAYVSQGPVVGAKAIGVFGGLQLIGKDVGVTWTKLAATADAKATEITVEDTVTWKAEQKIVISTTSYESLETEVATIKAVSGKTITLTEPLAFKHLGEDGQSSDGSVQYSMKADVGLLTRNVKIEGAYYAKQQEESFGARVIVGRMTENDETFTGNAVLSNVEFYNAGQEGYTDWYDPRFSLAFMNTGPVTVEKPSYVKKCSFNMNFNTAIGSYGTSGIVFQDNVIYHTVGKSMEDEGVANEWIHNLFTKFVFPGTYNGKNVKSNIDWDAAVMVAKAEDIVLKDNVVAGSERLGYRIKGDPCDSDTHMSTNNEAHGCLHGVHMIGSDGHKPCTRVSNFYVWKAYDYGVYFHVVPSVIVENVKIADSNVGIMPLIFLPTGLSHDFEDKFIHMRNNILIGRSSTFDCDNSPAPAIVSFNTATLSQITRTGGITGVAWGTFSSSKTMAPKLGSWADPGSYPAIRGVTKLTDNTFVSYGNICGSKVDAAIASNELSDDAQHPMVASGNTFIDVPEDSRVFMFRSRLSNVNPSDCVDMDCDGAKKLLLIDEDGNVLGDGQAATIIAEAEYEWDGDRRRGVGDYRIPLMAYTAPNGDRIKKEDKHPHAGIYRGDSCTYKPAWQAHWCQNIDHRMLVIESMDGDTEIRRLSPISIMTEPGPNGYCDLVNGPMDRGWCFGYTCQERISTFYTVVALGKTHEITITSTPPGVLRFHLLNAKENEAVLVKFYYLKPQRYSVYHEGSLVHPTNAELSAEGVTLKDPADPTNPVEFIPSIDSQVNGDNYYDRYTKFLYILLRGPGVYEVRTASTILLSMGLTVDPSNFFEDKVIENVAALLNIPKHRIRIMNVVRQSRYIRSAGDTEKVDLQLEIAPDDPKQTVTLDPAESGKDNKEQYEKSMEIVKKMANTIQTGGAEEALGVKVAEMEIVPPLPPPDDPPPKATEETGGSPGDGNQKTFSELQQEKEAQKLKLLLEPQEFEAAGDVILEDQPGGKITASIKFPQQPHVKIVDNNGTRLDSAGTDLVPWSIKASLVGNPKAKLVGQTVIPVENGEAIFKNLGVSAPGRYKIQFSIVNPKESELVAYSAPVGVTGYSLYLKVVQPTTSIVNKPFNPAIELTLYEKATKKPIDPNSQPYRWGCVIYQIPPGKLPILKGVLKGATRARIEKLTNAVKFSPLMISRSGHGYTLAARCIPDGSGATKLEYKLDPITILDRGESKVKKYFTLVIKAPKKKRFSKSFPVQLEIALSAINAVDPVRVGVAISDLKPKYDGRNNKVNVRGVITGSTSAIKQFNGEVTNLINKELKKKKIGLRFSHRGKSYYASSFRLG